MIRSISLITSVCLALASCTETRPPAQTSRSAVGPGAEQVDGMFASFIFTDICIDTLPRFAKSRTVLATMPFQQHPQTGTFYHRNLNLSIKLISDRKGKTCSMVFASKDKPSQLALFMSLAGASSRGANGKVFVDPDTGNSYTKLAGGARLVFRPVGQQAGKNYYNVAVTTAN